MIFNKEKEIMTDIWIDYEKGKMYNRSKNLYEQTEQNYDMYHGNQARYLNIGNEKPIIKNITKTIVKYKLGVVNSYAYAIDYNPNTYLTQEEGKTLEQICRSLSNHSNKVWEREKVGIKVKTVVKDACINDEGILHNYFDTTANEVKVEVIDKNNIYYGNENSSDIQKQPYIIISYRQPINQVRDYARKIGLSEEQIELINPDGETQEQAGYGSVTDEVNPMCLVLLKYYKKGGQVYCARSTKSLILEEDKSTGLELYPIAHMVWEEVKGSARGVGAVRYIIPNQLEINRIETRRALAVKLAAYPKAVINKDIVDNPESVSKVGATIKLKGGATVDDIRKYVGYLNPTQMSSDAQNLLQELQSDTREFEGAGDVATGTVDPTQASGKAILAVQQANMQPLNEQVDTYKSFIEDEARIWFDMWKAYKIDGMIVMIETPDAMTGETIEKPAQITNDQLKSMEVNIKIDITPKSPYDRFAMEQSIEGLMQAGIITFEEYVEALPDDSVMPKYILQNILKKRKKQQEIMNQMQANVEQMQNDLNMAMIQNDGTQIGNLTTQAEGIQNQAMNDIGGMQ